MGFLNPWLLLGLAGVAIPIIIHLLNRFRRRRIDCRLRIEHPSQPVFRSTDAPRCDPRPPAAPTARPAPAAPLPQKCSRAASDVQQVAPPTVRYPIEDSCAFPQPETRFRVLGVLDNPVIFRPEVLSRFHHPDLWHLFDSSYVRLHVTEDELILLFELAAIFACLVAQGGREFVGARLQLDELGDEFAGCLLANAWDAGGAANWFTNNLWISNTIPVAFNAGDTVLFDLTGSNGSPVNAANAAHPSVKPAV